MKIPDKIYVTIDRPAEKVLYNPELVGVAWSKKDKSCEHIEYIRKDALIEWVNEKLQESVDRLDFHANRALAEIKDKLNSM